MEHISHDHYCDRSVHPEVIEYIETHLDSTPRQLYQDIRAHPELKDLSTQTTQKQVWFWWGERSASSWRLCDESIINALGPAMLRPTDGPAAAKLAIEEFVIQHPNVGTGIVSSHMVGQTVSSEGGIRGIALYAFGIIAALRGQVVEVSLDATFGTNSSGHDLFAVMAELNGTGAPLMYFLLDTKDMKGDVRRIEMLVHVLGMLKGMGIAPRFVGCDKEAAEINAIGQVWPEAKVQLCYWHVRRALRQRFGNGKATGTNTYDAFEAAQTVQDLEVCWGVCERRRHDIRLCRCESRSKVVPGVTRRAPPPHFQIPPEF
ncbi:hypothetical protein CF328_g9082 [Tilletia controversa]|nr:hypothetical protein CF328_g9082 [Tilletia controversa]